MERNFEQLSTDGTISGKELEEHLKELKAIDDEFLKDKRILTIELRDGDKVESETKTLGEHKVRTNIMGIDEYNRILDRLDWLLETCGSTVSKIPAVEEPTNIDQFEVGHYYITQLKDVIEPICIYIVSESETCYFWNEVYQNNCAAFINDYSIQRSNTKIIKKEDAKAYFGTLIEDLGTSI